MKFRLGFEDFELILSGFAWKVFLNLVSQFWLAFVKFLKIFLGSKRGSAWEKSSAAYSFFSLISRESSVMKWLGQIMPACFSPCFIFWKILRNRKMEKRAVKIWFGLVMTKKSRSELWVALPAARLPERKIALTPGRCPQRFPQNWALFKYLSWKSVFISATLGEKF